MNKETFHISGGTGNIGQQNQTNITIISNQSISKKINKEEKELIVRKLPTLYQFSINIKNFISIIIVLFFSSTIFFPVENIKVFFILVSILIFCLCIYYFTYFKIIINDNFIKVKDRIFNFENIRKIKINRKIIDSHVNIYLEDSFYPDIKIYTNEEQIDLIEEFYRDYLKRNKKV